MKGPDNVPGLLSKLAGLVLGKGNGALARDAGFIFGIRMIGAVAVFATQILLARWAGAEALGLYSYAFAWTLLLTIFAGVGWPNAAYRVLGKALAAGHKDLMAGFVRRSREILLVTSTVITFIGAAILFAPGMSIADETRTALLLALIGVPFYGLMRHANSIAHGLSWWRATFLPDLAIRPVLLLGAIVAAYAAGLPLTAATVMAWQTVVIIVVAAGQTGYVMTRWRKRIGKPTPRYETAEWFRTAWPLLFVALFTNYFMEFNLIVAGHFLTPDDLGVFSAAFRTASLIGFGIFAVDAIIVPRAAQQHANGARDELQRSLSQAAWLKTAGALAAVVLMALFGQSLLGVFGAEFVPGYTALLILACAQLLVAIVGPAAQLLSVTGHQNDCLVVLPVSIVAIMVMDSVLIPRYGVNGAALTILLVLGMQSLWLHRVAVLRLGVQPSAFASRRG